MMRASLNHIMDLLHAQFCYQMLITPIPMPVEKKYRHFTKIACEFLEGKRSEVIHEEYPRHHVVHRFIPSGNHKGKKVLIMHGWMSRAAYMIRMIRALQQQGYELYALDFPAHGESKGAQLPWTVATEIIKETLNRHGPFYGAIGHSFGGSMLLNTLNLAGQLPDWRLKHPLERAVLIASPIQMHCPVGNIARRFKLSAHGYLYLRQLIREQTDIELSRLHIRHFITQVPQTPFLCIHGQQDETIHYKESMFFCQGYKNAKLSLLPDADHVSVLMDQRVEQLISNFFDD